VGYGITVEIDGRTIRVGSGRFMEMEGVSVPAQMAREMRDILSAGHSFVCVAIGPDLAGVLELQSSNRPEVEEVIAGLRSRGVKHMAIISGDHDKPTRRLASHLGMDRYFAEVLPQDKARYVELLQKEGRTVCFVGDGINDSIALKKANVSISLRGASTIATDTAQIVFMDEHLGRICDLMDYSNGLERNVRRSWNLILAPNAFCIGGVFFLGFNIWHSVAFNNASAILALMNGLLPLRRIARLHEARERLSLEAARESMR
jgi:Cu2+-exporting ATPase